MTRQVVFYMVVAYLLGSFPSAYLVARLWGGVDIRQMGDGNTGARNVFCEVGWHAGVVVAVLDVAKGLIAVLLAQRAELHPLWVLLVGGLVVLGHDFTIFLGFQGGQGMATSIGVLMAIMPWPTCAGLCITGLSWLLLRHYNLSWALGLGSVPLLAWITHETPERVWYPVFLLPVIGLRKVMQLQNSRQISATPGHRITK